MLGINRVVDHERISRVISSYSLISRFFGGGEMIPMTPNNGTHTTRWIIRLVLTTDHSPWHDPDYTDHLFSSDTDHSPFHIPDCIDRLCSLDTTWWYSGWHHGGFARRMDDFKLTTQVFLTCQKTEPISVSFIEPTNDRHRPRLACSQLS